MGICASVSHICQATMGSQRLGTYPVEAKLRVSMCHSSQKHSEWYICTAVTFRQYLMQFSKLSLLASKTPKCLKLLLLKWRWNIIWNQIYIQKVACFWEQLNIWYYPLENDWIIGPEWDHTNMSLLHKDEARKTNFFSLYEHETFTNRLEHVISKTGLSNWSIQFLCY